MGDMLSATRNVHPINYASKLIPPKLYPPGGKKNSLNRSLGEHILLVVN